MKCVVLWPHVHTCVIFQAIRKVEYDAASDTSTVECTPVHGRTHQIRLHLQVSKRTFSVRPTKAPACQAYSAKPRLSV